jgi:hypothetical protein
MGCKSLCNIWVSQEGGTKPWLMMKSQTHPAHSITWNSIWIMYKTVSDIPQITSTKWCSTHSCFHYRGARKDGAQLSWNWHQMALNPSTLNPKNKICEQNPTETSILSLHGNQRLWKKQTTNPSQQKCITVPWAWVLAHSNLAFMFDLCTCKSW